MKTCRTAAALLTLATTIAHAQTCWQYQDLGSLPGFPSSIAGVISRDGSIVWGTSPDDTQSYLDRTFRWTAAGGIQEVPPPPGVGAGTILMASHISANGSSIGGFIFGAAINRSAFLWSEQSGLHVMSLLPFTSYSDPVAISQDGTVLIGSARDGSGNYYRAFRWTQAGGIQDLGNPTRTDDPKAVAASADCSVVVGSVYNLDLLYTRPFRWKLGSGMQALPTIPGYNSSSTAIDVSADGSVVVGTCQHVNGSSAHAFRWTQANGTQDLGTLPGDSFSRAVAVSADGLTVVGHNSLGSNSTRAFRWTQVGGMQDLGHLPGMTNVVVHDISDNGNVVFGNCGVAGHWRPFRWTAATGMIELPTPAEAPDAGVVDMSADGTVMLGYTYFTLPVRSFRWTACPTCPADLDNDGDLGNGLTRDGAVTIEDFLSFLVGFEAGNVLVDLDNGSGAGTPDGGVDINDLLFFLARFEAGC